MSPAAVDGAATDPERAPDHLSARYLVALGGRLVREVAALARRAESSGKRLPTMAIDTEIRFRSAADRAAFADELTAAVVDLAARYHHDDGRPHRLVDRRPSPTDEFRHHVRSLPRRHRGAVMTTPDVPLRIEFEIEVPGTPEQVWEALATAAGISAWFLPTESEERLGGRLVTHMGPEDAPADITGWDPPFRFAYEEDIAALAGKDPAAITPLASEFLVEARSGGTCVVRVVSSAFGVGADWEQEFVEDMKHGWLPYFEQLRLYLRHFPGQRATTFAVDKQVPGRGAGGPVRPSAPASAATPSATASSWTARAGSSSGRSPCSSCASTHPVPGMLRVATGGPAGAEAVEVGGYLFPSAGTDCGGCRRGPAGDVDGRSSTRVTAEVTS